MAGPSLAFGVRRPATDAAQWKLGLASFCSSLQTRPEDRDPKTFSWGQVYLCEPLCARRKNLQLKNLVSSIFQRLNLLPPQEGEGFLSRGAALPSSPGGMTAAVLETLERLPSIKVRCITGWAYESDANLVLTEGPKGRAAPCLVLRITIRMSRKATMARGLAALTSGGTSATAALVRKTGAGWVESAGERLWWYNVVQYGGRGHKSCNWQGLRRPHATPHRSGRATELRGLVA
jgi:hypothetical protein